MTTKLGFTDWLKLILLIAVCWFVGAIVFVGSQGIAEDLAWHREIGLGFIGFGTLAPLALFSVRYKAFLIFLGASVYGSMAVWGAIWGGFPPWQSALMGLTGIGALLFAVLAFKDMIVGKDPARDTGAK